jgi:hypothetical protein
MRPDRWVEESFLGKACEVIARELEWDSLDSGRLHSSTTRARTPEGLPVVVGVLDQPARLLDLLEDAEQERRHCGLPSSVPLWLHVPKDIQLPMLSTDTAVVRRLPPT